MRKRRDTNSPDGAPAAYADQPSLAHAPVPSYTLPWWAAPRWVGMQLFACCRPCASASISSDSRCESDANVKLTDGNGFAVGTFDVVMGK